MTLAFSSRETPLKFERINTDARQKISKQATDVRTFRDERNRWESTPAVPKPVQPPKDRGGMVAPPAGRPPAVQPPKERGGTVTQPSGHKEAPTPATQRGRAFVPPREVKMNQPERVQIPVSPAVGRSGVMGIFQKGPPARPTYEDRDKEGKDIRKK